MQATTQSGSVGIKYPALEIVSQQMVYRNFSRNELGMSSELPKNFWGWLRTSHPVMILEGQLKVSAPSKTNMTMESPHF